MAQCFAEIAMDGLSDLPYAVCKQHMTRAKLSRAEMVRLWRDGMTGVEIAKLAGITAQAVSYHVKKVVGGAKERSRKKVAATMKGKT
jgi:DNA-binding CsgD family transcriptional regulator